MIYELQRRLNEAVAFLIQSFAETREWKALWIVLPLGAMFGALHALTPGHSKIVLASYLLGSRLQLSRSAWVAVALAVTHIASAVVLAFAAAPLVSRTLGSAGQAPSLELVSRGFLALLGSWLIFQGIRGRPHLHHEGIAVGIAAGIVPCPLTLFGMFLALANGVPAAGLAFAASMMLGVGLTLAGVAVVTILARDRLVGWLAHGAGTVQLAMRTLDVLAGTILVIVGVAAVHAVLT